MIGILSACVPADKIIDILDSVSIASSNKNRSYARAGDTVAVSFRSNEAIRKVTVTINGKPAVVTDLYGRILKPPARITAVDDTQSIIYEQSAVVIDYYGRILKVTEPTRTTEEDDTESIITNQTVIFDQIKLLWMATRTMEEDDTEGEVTFTIDFEDLEGNAYTQRATIRQTVTFDKTPPTITGEATTDANEERWYFSNVTVRFKANDRLSGIADMTFDVPTFTGRPPTMDVAITTEGENQSVTGIATDKAGNTASDTVTGINIKKLIIVAVMDGAAYEEKIFSTCEDAMGAEDLDVDSSTSYAELPSFGVNKMANAMAKINDLTSTMVYTHKGFGANRSDVRLLLVGKSLGGAKFYRILYARAKELDEFYKVGVVLVDSHCVGPADEGDCCKWNGPRWPFRADYVYFTHRKADGDCDDCGDDCGDDCFNLGWLDRWNDYFNSQSEQGESDSRLRIFNIYSRRLYDGKITSILGYSFRDAYMNLHAVDWDGYSYDNVTYTNGVVHNLKTGDPEAVTHWNIAYCRETSNLIREAIRYIRQ